MVGLNLQQLEVHQRRHPSALTGAGLVVGDLKLRDVEDDDLAEVTISQPLLKKYKQNLTAYCQDLKNHCTRRGISQLGR